MWSKSTGVQLWKGYQKYYNDPCKPIEECYNITDNIQSIILPFNNENKILSNFVYKEILLVHNYLELSQYIISKIVNIFNIIMIKLIK